MSVLDALDLAFIVVVALSTLVGLLRGFLRSSLLLVLWIVAVVLALRLGPPLAGLISPALVANAFLARLLAFVVLLLAVRILGGIALHALERDLANHKNFDGLDHTLGALYGFLRGVALVLLFLLAVRALGFHLGRLAPHSRLVPVLRPWVGRTGRFLSEAL